MSRTQKILLACGVLWLGVVTQEGILLLSESIGVLSTALASIGIVVFIPLALISCAWLWARPKPLLARQVLLVLTLPWLLATLGLGAGQILQGEAAPYSLRPSATPVEYYWARTEANQQTPSPDFYRDSVSVERLNIRFAPRARGARYGEDGIAVSGLVRNASNSQVVITGLWGEYVSEQGEVVGDYACDISVTIRCGVARIDLRPGYVADLSHTIALGPSLARRDTVSVYVRFRVDRPF